MSVPEHVTSRPTNHAESALEVELTPLGNGKVAEILHIGPYEEETPTIEKLKTFITENGDEISGSHEEEHLRGRAYRFFYVCNPVRNSVPTIFSYYGRSELGSYYLKRYRQLVMTFPPTKNS